jgi:hypothetical protein
MARNRTIYNTEGLMVSQNLLSSGSTTHAQLKRVQSANYGFEIARTDVNQFGELAAIDRLVTSSPTVNLDFSYYLADGYNERALGFLVSNSGGIGEGNFASGAIVGNSGVNFYIVTGPDGEDLNIANLSGKATIGIGNAFISNYSVSAAVGDFPTVSVSAEALNINAATYISGATTPTGTVSPAIAPESGTPINTNNVIRLPAPTAGSGPTALRGGDITFSFGDFIGTATGKASSIADLNMSTSNSINIQSFELSLPLSRSPIERLGSKFAFARVTDFPITATLSIEAIVNETVARNLASMIDDTTENDVSVTIRKPGSTEVAMKYTLKGARLDSESFSSDIGSNKSVSLTFSSQIGGPNATARGVFASGASVDTIFS